MNTKDLFISFAPVYIISLLHDIVMGETTTMRILFQTLDKQR